VVNSTRVDDIGNRNKGKQGDLQLGQTGYKYNIVHRFLDFRQPTPMDKLCYQVTDTGRAPIGSRVFGDCDLLMKELMKCLLADEERHEWEAELPGRLKEYAQQREAPTTE